MTKISKHDLEIHSRMVARLREGKQFQAQAQQLADQAARLYAGFEVWAEDLHARYELDATKGEHVAEDGTLVREQT